VNAKIDAIVTAGGRITGEFAEKGGVKIKALLNIGDRPVISRVLETLRSVHEIGRIIVIGPEEIRDSQASDLADEIIPEGENGDANLMLGLEACINSSRVLFAASDLPFLTPQSIGRFIAQCDGEGDFFYPVLTKKEFIEAYPESKILYARLRDGLYTGGCVFMINPSALLANREMIERVFNSRKSLVKLAGILGWSFVIKMLTRTLSIDDCVKRGSELIGCKCRVVADSPPELAYDLDDINDFEYALIHAGRVYAQNPR
jgi:molybdopterin-guanine dinucleotide biosynthesis protein A